MSEFDNYKCIFTCLKLAINQYLCMQNDQIVIYAQSFLEAVQQLQAELPEISDTRTSTTTSSISAPGTGTTGAGIAGTGTGTSTRTTEDAAKTTQKSTKPVTQSKKFQDIGLISPVSNYTIVGVFNPNVKIKNRAHMGIDFSAPDGTSIFAVTDGVVTNVTTVASGVNKLGGNTVSTLHSVDGKKITTYNAHLGKIYVSVGQKIKQGEIIGTVSNTGAKHTGPHLHFELRENGNLIDPFTYIKRTASSDESQITKLASILKNHYDI